ncbi:hypothetical protein P12x_000092 [Tundrisphaera lichenicola]|uniref:hypothetical protein n=1 Tax=Tundrisphaera lichenicola TaxID=2029860 RepID=UPI003EBA3AF6
MTIPPDAYERSRAAVAISCLKWLQCTGPASDRVPDRIVEFPSDDPPLVRVREVSTVDLVTHPLWDRWLDG